MGNIITTVVVVMKKYKSRLLTLVLTLSVMTFITSCDFLLPAPLGRDNPDDDGAQIVKFAVTPSGADSIVTVWNWKAPDPATPENQVIDKIRIVHNSSNPPSSMYPLNKDDYVDIDSKVQWKFEWENLREDSDHYFALYAHEKSGTWLAPLHKFLNLNYNPPQDSYILVSDDNTAPDDPEEFKVWYFQQTPYVVNDFSTMGNYSWPVSDIFVLRFKDFNPVYFDKFLFFLHNTTQGPDVELKIYPLKKNKEDISDWNDLISPDTMDYSAAMVYQILDANGDNQLVDISDVADKMVLNETVSIALSIDTGLMINPSAWTIETHSWGTMW